MSDIVLTVEEEKDLELQLEEEKDLELQLEEVTEITISNYEELTNKPKINGTELVGNYDEIDPTVPDWAKNATPPSASDIGAVDESDIVSFNAIDTMLNSIFG